MTFYDEYGNEITLEISDNGPVLEALTVQTEQLEKLVECQAKSLETLETVVENQTTVIAHLEAENAKLTEMNQYTAYIFVIVLFAALYKVLGGALSSMFGGG